MRYRLLGIDLDGTLLQPDHSVAAQEREAIAAAQEAGCLVVPCTGRSWQESAGPLKPVAGLTEGVFVTGCLVQRIVDGEVLHRVALDPELAHRLIEHLRGVPEAVLAFHTRSTRGHDFLVTGDGELTENTAWWFEHTGAAVKHQRNPGPEDLADCVRVGVVSTLAHLGDRLESLRSAFGDAIHAHSFAGVKQDGREPVEILEVFPPGVSKWTGIRMIAEAAGIADGEIAFIGDEINDVPALRAAGLSVAMGNAVPEAAATADRHTASNTEHGVAEAVHRMLGNQW